MCVGGGGGGGGPDPLSSADPEGGTGSPDPPLENHKLYGFL